MSDFLITYVKNDTQLALAVKNNRPVLIPVDYFLQGDLADGLWEVDMDNNHGRGPGGIHHLFNKKYGVYVDDRDGQAVLVKSAGGEEPLLAFELIAPASEHGGDAYWHIGTRDADRLYMTLTGSEGVGFVVGEQSIWLLAFYRR